MARKDLYPYEVATNAVSMRLLEPRDPSNPALDLSWLDAELSDEGVPRADLRGDTHWRQLCFGVEAQMNPTRLKELLPKGADVRADVGMLLAVQCPRTKFRFAIDLASDPISLGHWSGEVTILKRDVRSRVEMRPILFRRTAIPEDAATSGLARRRQALLAYGRTQVATIDHVERSADGVVQIKFEDFRASPNGWRKDHDHTLYFLEIDPERPTLWLNSKHRKLRALLFDQSSAGPDSALRQLLMAWLAETVWMQLFQAALGSVRAPGFEMDSIPTGWRAEVLRMYTQEMFPEAESFEDALGQAVGMKESPDGMSAVVSLATTATQQIVKTHNHFIGAIRSIETAVEEAPNEQD